MVTNSGKISRHLLTTFDRDTYSKSPDQSYKILPSITDKNHNTTMELCNSFAPAVNSEVSKLPSKYGKGTYYSIRDFKLKNM